MYDGGLKELSMDRKEAADYPQEVLDLFHEYQHGDMSRRTFIDRLGKYATGGVTAMAIFESLRPNYAWAQQIKKDDARIKTEYATVSSPAGNGSIKGYLARPASAGGQVARRHRHPREPRTESLHRGCGTPAGGREVRRVRARRPHLSGRLPGRR